jgi:hypothetical protein
MDMYLTKATGLGWLSLVLLLAKGTPGYLRQGCV